MQCPCDSNKKSVECCLQPDGSWYKPQVDIYPAKPQTGFSNPKCYISQYNDCSRRISKEHYMSEAILRELGEIKSISGFPWLYKKEKPKWSTANFTAKVLCERHNNCLSPLDQEATRFFRSLKIASDTSLWGEKNLFLFNGNDIERWMLKTLYGCLYAKVLQANPREKIRIVDFTSDHLDLLFDKRDWQERQGLFVRTEVGYDVTHRNLISCGPVINNAKSTIHGMLFNMRGHNLLLSTAPINVEDAIYRPKQIVFEKDANQKIIKFSWNDARFNKVAKFTWKGKH
jgi:hypothetical protein